MLLNDSDAASERRRLGLPLPYIVQLLCIISISGRGKKLAELSRWSALGARF